jgi:DNA-binding CsgD family transcriptional regulator
MGMQQVRSRDFQTFSTVFDALCSSRKDLGQIDEFLLKVSELLNAYVGFTIFDGTGSQMLYSLWAPQIPDYDMASLPDEFRPTHYSKLFADLIRREIKTARRLSDMYDRSALASDPWLSLYCYERGVEHLLMQDLQRPGRKARLYAHRKQGSPDFSDSEVDLFECIVRQASALLEDSELVRIAELTSNKQGNCVRYTQSIADTQASRLAWHLQSECGLTPTETRVTLLLATGLSPDQIGFVLSATTATVRAHIKRVHEKLSVRRLGELFVLISTMPGWQEYLNETRASSAVPCDQA